MDKLEIRVIAITSLILCSFIVALLYASQKKNADVPLCVPYSNKFEQSHFKQLNEKTYEVFYVSGMWKFEPSEVYIPAGSELDIYLSSKDVVHGFHIEKKAFNLMAVPGAITKQTLRFEKPGVYKIVCHEYCGSAHQNMQAEIIVN